MFEAFTAATVIYLLTQHGLVVNGQSGGILVVLVLGASTDYALLLVARYREELRRHQDRHEAMENTNADREIGPVPSQGENRFDDADQNGDRKEPAAHD